MLLNGLVARLFTGMVMVGALTASAMADEPLPKSTEKMLQDLKIAPAVMKGIDQELTVPKEWMDGARKEGTVKILGSWDIPQFTTMVAPFKERYPFIKLDYTRGDFNARAVKPLIALKEGRYVTDILTGFGGSTHFYQQMGALEDLRELPGFKNPLPGTGDPEGTWVGSRLRYWCMTYNTNLVKTEDLPKKWEDLLTDPKWSNGNLGIANRPQLWLLMLWGEHDEQWVANYMDKFFSATKPQLRKEGENALLALLVAGEFHASLPSADYRTKQYHDKGAPVGWHCPEPIPLAVSQMGILKGNPHINASRVWVNWFLSKEGQIGQFVGDKATPLHRDLQTADFLAYPDELKGKKIAARTPDSQDVTEKLMSMWNEHWVNSGEKSQAAP